MNSNMMNRNSMGCINRGGMNQRDMGSMCRRPGMDGNHGCHPDCDTDRNNCNRSGNMPMNNNCDRTGDTPMGNNCGHSGNKPMNNGCGCSRNMPENNGCGRPGHMPDHDGCNRPGHMPDHDGCNHPGHMPDNNSCTKVSEQQLMGMNKNQLLNYLNHVSFSMFDTVLFLDTHPTDREAIAYFNEMKQARKIALKIYQKQFAPLLLDGVDANCEWTWGMEPLPWENC